MINKTLSKYCIFLILTLFALNSCANRGDARKTPPQATERVKQNVEEGRGFRIMDKISTRKKTNFQFASSNELWRASLDVIDFMPLTSANYSGGIIITDWYSENENTGESIKLVIRFLTNEIRTDAINLKIFYKNCISVNNCKVSEKVSDLNIELKKEILKRAALYKEETKEEKN
jgi:hypothetical protein